MAQQCSYIVKEENIIKTKQFHIPIEPASTTNGSYGLINKYDRIIQLVIIKEKFIPLTIFSLKYLERLEIHKTCFQPCNQQKIPSNIQCLASSLIEFEIYNTKIIHLPPEIGQLNKLKVFKLFNTGLISLPASIGRLTSLTHLILPNNHIKILPQTFQTLRSLEQIILSNNPKLESIQILNGLSSLRIINAQNCSIKKLPRHLPQLTHLYLSKNSLSNLNGISNLGEKTTQSKSFYFEYNQIKYLPIDIDRIHNLQRLKLDQNQLTYLSKNIFNISTLIYFTIEHNPINEDDMKKYRMKFKNSGL